MADPLTPNALATVRGWARDGSNINPEDVLSLFANLDAAEAELADLKREEVTLREMLAAAERAPGNRAFCLTTTTAKGQRPRFIVTGPADREDAMASMVVNYFAALETIAMDLAVKRERETIRAALGLAPEATTAEVMERIGALVAAQAAGARAAAEAALRARIEAVRVTGLDSRRVLAALFEVCRVEGCAEDATHGPDGEAVACWAHAGDWPEVRRG